MSLKITPHEKTVVEDLQEIVRRFNDDFENWSEKYGCSASFTWNYSGKDYMKQLSLQTIDRMIYRRPPPGAKTLQDILKEAEGTGRAEGPVETGQRPANQQ